MAKVFCEKLNCSRYEAIKRRDKMNHKKKRAAYVGLSCHSKTQSTVFIINILKSLYRLDVYLDESWLKGGAQPNWDAISEEEYDTIVFFQYFRESKIMHQIRCENKIFIPMYDGMQYRSSFFWKQFRGIKIINFCKQLHSKMITWGLDSYYIQYFPEANPEYTEINYNENKVKVFFWLRTRDVSWSKVRKWIENLEVSSVHLHYKPDPGQASPKPSKADVEKYKISISDWFENKADYESKMQACDLFIAPRKREGIGMSFLEAMANGRCVLGYDNPTLNEYIVHNQNGILLKNNSADIKIDKAAISQMGRSAYETVQKGRLRYLESLDGLKQYIQEPKNHGVGIGLWKLSMYAWLSKCLNIAAKIMLKLRVIS